MKKYSKAALVLTLLFCPILLVGWTELVDNFYGKNLDKTTFQSPPDTAVPVYSTATGKWSAIAGGGGGGSDASDTVKGITKLSVAPAVAANPIAVGNNDTRLNPTPSGAGKMVFDGGGGVYVALNAGTVDQVLMGGTSPFFNTVAGDLSNSAGTFTIAANAVSDTKLRDSAALSVIGRSANSSGDPGDIDGTANQILVVSNTSVLDFVTVSGDLTNVTGAFTIANNAITSAKINNGAVAYADIQDLTGLSLMGRSASTSGVGADITGTANQIPVVNSGGTALAFTTLSGDVTNASGVMTIANNAVSNAKFRQGAARSLVGVAGNATANVADIQGTANQIPIVNSGGTALAFTTLSGDVTNASGAMTIAAQAVGVAKMTASATDVVFGRSSAGAGAGQEIAFTSTARSIADDTSVGAVRTTLSAVGTVNVQVFTADGTYTPTSGMLYCIVEAVGGGGGGGGVDGNTSFNLGAAGGGAGGYTKVLLTAAEVGASKAVDIGAGGAGGAAAGSGSAGSDTTLGTTLVVAKGGSGAAVCTSAGIPKSVAGGVAGSETAAATGILATGMRGAKGAYSNTGTTLDPAGDGGSTPWGGGGTGGGAIGGGVDAGAAGSGFGSGGGGGSTAGTATDTTGGNGAAGVMIITEYLP